MPTYMLEGAAAARLSSKPLIVSLRVDPPGVRARLDAVCEGQVVAEVVRPRPDLLVLPRVVAPTTIQVSPVDGQRFPAPCVVHVSVVVEESTSVDPERAVLVPLDVAGLDSRAVLVLEPEGHWISARQARVLAPPADVGPVGNTARVLATEILGVQAVPEAESCDVVIAVDGSASMRPLVEDGSVADVLRVLEGVSQVLSPGRQVRGMILGALGPAVTAAAGQCAPELTASLAAHRPGTGVGVTELAPVAEVEGGSRIVYVVSDAVPTDLHHLRQRVDSRFVEIHLVLIASAEVARLLGPLPEQCTVVDISSRSQAYAPTSLTAEALRPVVRSLMAGSLHLTAATTDRNRA